MGEGISKVSPPLPPWKILIIHHVVCTDLWCVVCIGLLSAEFSTVNTGLGRHKGMFWKPLCLLSTSDDLATTNYQLA